MTQTATEIEIPWLDDYAQLIEQDLALRIDRFDGPENLLDAIRYSVLDGGKRLRPILTLVSCQAVGGQTATALPAASAIEFIHCFSLIHDDLPALDDDDLRRGRASLHVHAGEAMAILAGDALMSLAFEIVNEVTLPGEDRSRLCVELAKATTAMIAGQVYDTLGGFPPETTDERKLLLIHRNKTEALIRSACRLGAICGAADPTSLAALSEYGEAIGFMFQIVDDLLDVTQSSEHLGKQTGKDESAGKITHPGTFGIEITRREIRRLHHQALKSVEPLGKAAEPLADICNYLAVRTR